MNPSQASSSSGHAVAGRLAEAAERSTDGSIYDHESLRALCDAFDVDIGFYVRNDQLGVAVGMRNDVRRRCSRHIPRYGAEFQPVLEEGLDKGLAVDREVMGTQFQHTQVYRELIAPHAGHSTALIPLRYRGELLGLLALGRVRRGFSRAELSCLRELVPVLQLCEANRPLARATATLTRRERDVLDYLCLGYANREIAQACETSVHTVRNQLQSVYRKLGATTRAEAVGIALRRVPA